MEIYLLNKMEKSILYHNVYKLVDRKTNELCDISEIDKSVNQRYRLEVVSPRVPLLKQYEQMYNSVEIASKRTNTGNNFRQNKLNLSTSDCSSFNLPQTSQFSHRQNRATFFGLKSKDQIMQSIQSRNQSNQVEQTLVDESQHNKSRHQTSQFMRQPKLFLSPIRIKQQSNEFTKQSIGFQISQYQKAYDIYKFSREDLKRFVKKVYKIEISEVTAIEGIHFARGSLMEKSQTFDKDKLIDWLVVQLPILSNANVWSKQAKLMFKSSPKKQVNDQDQFQKLLRSVSQNKQAQNKLVGAMMQLEATLDEERQKQGILAQLAAQRRLQELAKEKQLARENEISRQLLSSCQFDSAVRAITLAEQMKKTWSEEKGSYKVVSHLSLKQQRRLKDMQDKRLTFI